MITKVTNLKHQKLSNAEFAAMADPHAWLLVADNLHAQAVRTRESARGELLIRINGPERVSWDVTERATILLSAFAIENALKAFLVYEHPQWISNGSIGKTLRSHNLVHLRSKSTLLPYRHRYTALLRFLNDGINSWARYPCALSANETKDLPVFSGPLWFDYTRLMAAYGRKLSNLLETGWAGPHGTGGTWDCSTMNFLQISEPKQKPPKRAFTV